MALLDWWFCVWSLEKNILKNIAGHLRVKYLPIYSHNYVNSYYWINQNIFTCGIFAKKSCHVTFKVKVTQLDTTLCDPMDYSPWNFPGRNTGVGSWSLPQGIFPNQGENPGFPHCRWILYQLSHQGSPVTFKDCHKDIVGRGRKGKWRLNKKREILNQHNRMSKDNILNW